MKRALTRSADEGPVYCFAASRYPPGNIPRIMMPVMAIVRLDFVVITWEKLL